MKVYFCGSIRGGRDDVDIYRRFVQKLQSYGTVLTEHVSSRQLGDAGQTSHTRKTDADQLFFESLSNCPGSVIRIRY